MVRLLDHGVFIICMDLCIGITIWGNEFQRFIPLNLKTQVTNRLIEKKMVIT